MVDRFTAFPAGRKINSRQKMVVEKSKENLLELASRISQ